MNFAPSPTDDEVFAALRDFLIAIVPAGCDVIQGQPNRVPEPTTENFVVMTPRSRPRLSTNVDTYRDVAFTASIAAAAMTVTAVQFGKIGLGNQVFGVGVAANTTIASQTSGPPGGAGVYVVAPEQTVASRRMAAGALDIQQSTEVVVQLDAHGPISADVAQTITTLMRSPWGVDKFEELNPGCGVALLYADDPKQLPFSNDQQQQESRWMVEAHLQVKPTITVSQQFAAAAVVGLAEVDERYPAQ